MDNKQTQSSGVGFLGLLALLFIGLKLVGVIDWSWWWVTSPLWGAPVFIIVLAIAVFLVATIAELVGRKA